MFKSTNVQLNSSSIASFYESYAKSNMLCMNELELRHDLRDRNGEIKLLVKNIKKNSSKYYLITRGKDGVLVFNKEK